MLEQYEDVLTVTDLQEILSIGRNLAYYLLQTKQIASVKVGKAPALSRTRFSILFTLSGEIGPPLGDGNTY